MLLGDTATGKSSMLKNYMSNARTKASIPTVNFECLTALHTNPQKYLQIWDTPGKEKYRLVPMSFIGAFDYAIVFYDITNKHTFDVAQNIVASKQALIQILQTTTIESK